MIPWSNVCCCCLELLQQERLRPRATNVWGMPGEKEARSRRRPPQHKIDSKMARYLRSKASRIPTITIAFSMNKYMWWMFVSSFRKLQAYIMFSPPPPPPSFSKPHAFEQCLNRATDSKMRTAWIGFKCYIQSFIPHYSKLMLYWTPGRKLNEDQIINHAPISDICRKRTWAAEEEIAGPALQKKDMFFIFGKNWGRHSHEGGYSWGDGFH